MKTSELTGAALDWAVAKAGNITVIEDFSLKYYPLLIIPGEEELVSDTYRGFAPSSIWAQGGPIIEREKIFLVQPYRSRAFCKAYKMEPDTELPCWLNDGPTPLIAAMRCYVANKLGDEVEIPEELK